MELLSKDRELGVVGKVGNLRKCFLVNFRCDTRACRLQSPNYPGVYPRNVTCYYRVEQKRAPPGHRALLAVSQRNSHKIHIKDQVVKYDRSQRILKLVLEIQLCTVEKVTFISAKVTAKPNQTQTLRYTLRFYFCVITRNNA